MVRRKSTIALLARFHHGRHPVKKMCSFNVNMKKKVEEWRGAGVWWVYGKGMEFEVWCTDKDNGICISGQVSEGVEVKFHLMSGGHRCGLVVGR